LTEIPDKMNKDVRKKTLKYLDKKGEYCLTQSWSKWKWLKITTKQGSFTKK